MVFNNHKRTAGKRRVLRTEFLEERVLLSAVPLTSGEYTDLTAKYSALELPKTTDELNVITLDLSEGDGLAELKTAIAEAKKTPQSDLIVVRTTADANTITYTASGDRLEIAIDSSSYGSLAIVGFGDAPLTLDANQLGHHMYLRSSSMNIFMANMTLTGGNFTNGSAIFNASKSLTIVDCTITGNTASTSGGAIFSQGNGITIVDSVFCGNSAAKNGGAICCTRGKCTIINSVFSENSAESGGSISADGSLIITDSEIRNNTASNIGGGIYNKGYAEILDCEIVSNIASCKITGEEELSSYVYGGGIYNDGNMTLTDSKVAENIARYENQTFSEEIGAYGGGICNEGSLTTAGDTVTENLTDGKLGTSGGSQTLGLPHGAAGSVLPRRSCLSSRIPSLLATRRMLAAGSIFSRTGNQKSLTLRSPATLLKRAAVCGMTVCSTSTTPSSRTMGRNRLTVGIFGLRRWTVPVRC